MDALDRLPSCRIFHIEKLVAPHTAGMIEGREDSDGELAFVRGTDGRDGFATLIEGTLTVEWYGTQREKVAVFSAALRRLGWRHSIHAWAVYGEAN